MESTETNPFITPEGKEVKMGQVWASNETRSIGIKRIITGLVIDKHDTARYLYKRNDTDTHQHRACLIRGLTAHGHWKLETQPQPQEV